MFGFVTLDTDLKVTQWNQWLADYTGVPEEQALSKTLEALFPEITKRGLHEALHYALESRAPLTISHILHRYLFPPAKGAPRPQSALIQPLIQEGVLSGLAIAVQDVSDRLLAENELQWRIQHLETLREIDRAILLEDLDAVFQHIVEQAQRQFEALWCAVFLLEGDRLVPWVYTGVPENGTQPEILKPGQGIIGQVAQSGKARRVLNIHKDPDYVPYDPRVQAEMAVPIQTGERIWGVLNVECESSKRLVGDALEMLESLAAEAAIALHTDSLRRKEQHRLQALTLLRELGLHLDEAQDLNALYDLSVRYAVRLLEASSAILHLYDPEEDARGGEENTGLTFAAGPGFPGGDEGVFWQPRPDGLTHSVAQKGEPLIINDPAHHPLYGPALAKKINFHAIAGFPLLSGGQVIAVLTMTYAYARAFEPEDAELVGLLAEQIVVQIERARHRQAEALRLAELESVSRISAALRQAESVDEMLPILLDQTLAAMRAQDGAIWVYQRERRLLERAAARGWPGEIPELTLAPGEGIAGQVFASRQPQVSREYSLDPMTSPSAREQIPPGWGGVCVPIQTSAEVIGVFFICVELPRVIEQPEVHLLSTLAEIAANAMQRSRLHEETRRRLDYVSALRSIESAITTSFDLRLTLNILVEQAQSLLQVDALDVVLFDPVLNTLTYTAGAGFGQIPSFQTSLPLGNALAGRAIMSQRRVSLHNLSCSDPLPREEDTHEGGEITYFCIPLMTRGRILGALEVFKRGPLYPDQEWLNALDSLAAQAAIAMDNANMYLEAQDLNLQINQAYNATLESWGRAVEARKQGGNGHIERVTGWSLDIARELKLPGPQLADLRRGVLLHDVGELIIPETVLNKPGPLEEEEWELVRRHPLYAQELLSNVKFLDKALQIPLAHHERWDGSGYPLGLKGDLIPLGARIFAVVDVYDALISPRPYRQAWSAEEARQFIQEGSGSLFDPQVVRAFRDVLPKFME